MAEVGLLPFARVALQVSQAVLPRYRGLRKNANRLFTTCALVNLFLVRKRLLCATAG